MPEPVVIIGPAKGPAGPIGEPAEAVDRVAAHDTGLPPDHELKKGKRKKSMLLPALARLGSWLFMLLTRGPMIIAKLGMSVVTRYPRHSLAAGASLMILGAIWYTQNFSPVSNEIKAASSTGSPTVPKNAANTKTDGGAASPDKLANKDSGGPKVANPHDKVTALTGAGSLEDKPAPASTLVATDDADPPLPPLHAGAPTAGQNSEPAPEKAALAADLTATKTEPAPTPASSVDQSTPTLLGSALTDPAPSPSSRVVKDDKGDGDSVKPAPAMEAPALIAALALSPNAPAEVAPAPAPAGDPVQLATSGDDQNKSSPASALKPPPQSPASGAPQPAAPTGETANADIKPNAALAPAEPKTVLNPQDTPNSGAVSQSNPAISQPESTPSESVKSELPTSVSAKAEALAPAALGPADNSKVASVSPSTSGVPVPGSDVAGIATPPVESSAARAGAPATAAQNTGSQPSMPALTPVASAPPLDSQMQIPDSRSQVVESKPQISDAREPRQSEPDARPRAIQEPASAGWVSVPNSGKNLFEDTTHGDALRDDSSSGMGAESAATRDVRGHAAKDVSFELESSRTRGTAELEQNGRQSVLGSGAASEHKSRSTAGRVEPNAHVVEPLENFWTISRLYYSSGRYYKALWKANADKYPKIDNLKVNDVIMVPAVEDLDPAYVDPPRARAPVSLGTARRPGGRSRTDAKDAADGVADGSVSSSAATPGEPISTARTNRGSGDAFPVRRSSRTDPDLDLPTSDAVSRRESAPDRTGRRVNRPLGDDDSDSELETRTVARPRATAAASGKRPVYKIRQYDTLRSIARDMLGDSHRSSEILDLNHDLIDDPAHLIVGQVLELPEDARTSVRRSASR